MLINLVSHSISLSIYSQLFYDGYKKIGNQLSETVGHENASVSPSDRLMNLIAIGLQHENGWSCTHFLQFNLLYECLI